MNTPSATKLTSIAIQDLREKRVALQAAESASGAVTTAHIAMRCAGMGGCTAAMDAARAALTDACAQFRAAYSAVEDGLNDDDADLLHRAVWDA